MFFLSLFLCCNTYAATAQEPKEQVLNYSSNIVVNQNASIDVTEKITVFSNEHKIRHGIVRWLPLNYFDIYGLKHHYSYRINQVSINNTPSPYFAKRQRDEFVIYCGDLSTSLSPGEYTYVLQYHVKDGVSFLQDLDSFYWNVTGNTWDVPIQHAEVTIHFPSQTQITAYTAATGLLGTDFKNYTVTRPSPNVISFVTTQPLERRDSFTVSISWPKGIVKKPSLLAKISSQAERSLIPDIALIVIICVLLVWYLRLRSLRKQQDPLKKPS